MANSKRALTRSVLLVWSALATACVATELAAPSGHPGHPQARSGQSRELNGLRADFDASREGPAAPSPDSHAGHDSHVSHQPEAPVPPSPAPEPSKPEAHEASPPPENRPASAAKASPDSKSQSGGDVSGVRYTCPMHPEIDTSKPGPCPKCGMKLVPKKAKQ
jgi:hypothetical protein